MNRLLLFALLPLALFAQHVPGAFSLGPRTVKPRGPKRLPQGYALQTQSPPLLELGPLTAGEAVPLPRHGAYQIGVQRLVPAGWLSLPLPTALPGGRQMWQAALRSNGAVSLRVHFHDFSVRGGEVWLYDIHRANLAGPYTGTLPDFWSSPVAADQVVIEFDAAPGTTLAAPPFRIDGLVHQWESVVTPRTTPTGPAACELDVTCYPQWSPYASGVVMYTYAGDGGGYYACSGALLNPAGAAFAPFLLTANHCISSDSEAQSANIIFGDETSVCNGTEGDVHALGGEARTTYLASAPFEDGDYSLLTLTAPAPAGVYLFGWTTTAPAIGDPVVGIHHPVGSWARIAFGQRGADAPVDINDTLVPPQMDYQVNYTQGLIEPGSSGSPLLNSNAEVIGTASGILEQNSGESNCQLGYVRAAYGKLSVAYPALESYLSGTVNPAPAFSVTPTALAVTEANGQVTNAAALQVTTTSLLPVPLSVQYADSWLQVTAQNEFDMMPAMINSDTPLNLYVGPNTLTLILSGVYQTSVTITVGSNAPVIVPVTLTVANTQSRVLAAMNGNPFLPVAETLIAQVPGTATPLWHFNISLTEGARVATTVTSLVVAGQDISGQIASIFGSATIPPAGSVSGVVDIANVVYNDSNFVDISGVDQGSGTTWTQHLLVQFTGPAPTPYTLLASGIPALLYPNNAMPDCPLRQHIVLQAADASVTLNALARSDATDASSMLANLASTNIPAGGSVQGDLCWPNTTDPDLFAITNWTGLVFRLTGTDSNGTEIDNNPGVAFFGPPAIVAQISATPPAIQFASAAPPPATLSVDPGIATLAWTATIVYEQSPAAWLTLTPASGIGPATMKISSNAAGLIPGGVYRATCIIQSLISRPQYLVVPVTFQIPSTGLAVLNSASFAAGTAPGMVFSVFDPGATLANGIEAAGTLPLPLTMQGTSVTVNNVPAPLYYVSSTQLNVQIPYESAPGPATLTVSNASKQIASQSIYVNAVAPGIFLANDRRHIAPNSAATAGGYVTLYLTGQGPVSPAVATGAAPPSPDQVPVSGLPKPFANLQVLVNGVQAQIDFAGIPYYLVGVTQINFIVPPGTPPGDQPVVVTLAGVPSNTGYITVGP